MRLIDSGHKKLTFLTWVIGLIVAYFVVVEISRIGETRINIATVPKQSEVFVNGERHSQGSIYLKPGNYTFTAKAEGYKDDTLTLDIGDKAVDVGLIPEPDSDEAREYLKNNPSIQAEREKIGGERANAIGEARKNQTPVIELLPVTELLGPFSIDYGPSEERENGIFLIVSDSSPSGRENSLKWLRDRGQDPTDLEIRFVDFDNPIKKKGSL